MDDSKVPDDPITTALYLIGVALFIYWLIKSGPPENGGKS